MQSKELKKYKKLTSFQDKKILHYIIIPILMGLTYLIVYATDKKVYGHAMYIPIIYASFALGLKYSVIVGFIGGLILGPLIPFSVVTGEQQEPIEWVFRLIMYTGIGFFSGLLISIIKSNSLKIIDLLSHNQETNLPNKNGIKLICPSNTICSQSVITVIINNYDVLLELFSYSLYYKLIKRIANILQSKLPNTQVIHADENKLWVTTDLLDKDCIVEAIFSNLTNNIIIDNIHFYVDLVIGISTIKEKGDNQFLQGLRDADTAARHAQKNRLAYAVYDGSKIIKQQDFELLSSFNKALNNGEIYLDYQPIINLKTKRIEKLEALVRWNHPTIGLISPDLFIPLIEQTLLIHLLSTWVLSKVIEKIKQLEKHNINITFAINISANNLYNEEFIQKIIELKEKNNIKDNLIELELTESEELVHNNTSIENLARLKNSGFQIAIDDFGKGYSSLTSLHMFPATTLKIDRYFTSHLASDPNIIHIIEGVIIFAHKHNIKITFEGIETEQIHHKIREINSDYGQGYYYSKPTNFNKILEYFINNDGYINID